jgi:alpha-glucosidase
MHAFTQGDRRLNSAYGFNFLYADKLTPALVRDALAQWPDTPGTGWPSWAFENHDAPRAISRWADPAHRDAFARMKLMLLVSLRGNIFLYNGEELGLTQVDIPFEALRDPEAIANWPLTLSRDGARTPIPWRADANDHAGFSSGTPWLPIGGDHLALAVDRQNQDPASLLNLTRRLLAFRHASDALMRGDARVIEASETILAIERSTPDETMLCVFNMSTDPVEWHPAQPDRWQIVEAVGIIADWRLDPYAAVIARQV